MSTAVLGHAVLGHMVLGQVGSSSSPVDVWALYHNSTSIDPRGTGSDPLREVVSRETLNNQRLDVLACGHRFPTAGSAAKVADGRLMRRCPLDFDLDDH